MNILACDPDIDFRSFLEIQLGQLDEAKVFLAPSGERALQVMEETYIDFFISSWDLAGMSGMVLMQRVRHIPKYLFTPFMIYSEELSKKQTLLAKEFRVEDFLLKPFKGKAMREMIIGILDREFKTCIEEKTLRRCEMLLINEEPEAARDMLEPLLKKEEFEIRAMKIQGDTYMAEKLYKKALINYQKVLEKERNNIDALNGLVKAYIQLGEHEEAIPFLEKLNEVIPGHVDRMLDLGTSYIETDQLDKAKDVLKEVAALDEQSFRMKMEKGKVAFKEGDLELATQMFRESKQATQICSYFNNSGVALVKAKKINEGLDLYHKAIKTLPAESQKELILYNIGLAYFKSEQLEQALEYFCQAKEMAPTYEKAESAIKTTCMRLKKCGADYDKKRVKNLVQK